jgi:glutathione S-transferase
MLTLFHFPFCPHSRFARLALAELGLPVRLIEERVWQRREEFLLLNPAGTLPVLLAEGFPPVPGAGIIAEFLNETLCMDGDDQGLMPAQSHGRAEVRRLMSWFNDKLFAEVSGPLSSERLFKRHTHPGSPPDSDVIRDARQAIPYHFSYLEHALRTRKWLAGDVLTYADLAAAAHLSIVDYLGHAPWTENHAAEAWYTRLKARPSFGSLLTEKVSGIRPPANYAAAVLS